MAEIKNTFTLGRMNKDLDERLVPNGEYRDALNVNITNSEGSDVGAVENLLGNEKISAVANTLENPKTIGSIKWDLQEKIYWFVTSDYSDAIYEYNQTQNKVEPVLVDLKSKNNATLGGVTIKSNENSELIIKNYYKKELESIIGNDLNLGLVGSQTLIKNTVYLKNTVYNIDIEIPKNTIIEYKKNNELVFYDVEYLGNELEIIDLEAEYVYNTILNFNKNTFITGINIIDGILFWTDDFNQPRKIDITKFKKYTDGNANVRTQINGKSFTEKDIAVAKKAPLSAPKIDLSATPNEIGDYIRIISLNFNGLNTNKNNKLTITWKADNIQWKVGSFILFAPKSGQQTNITGELEVTKITGGATKEIELKILSINGEVEDKNFIFELKQDQEKALYELKFPRFSYRWKYNDGEYSVLSPFSETAFLPGTNFLYNHQEGYNLAMTNNARSIKLTDISLGDDDVEEIQIVYKDSSNNNLYIIDKKNKSDFNGIYELEKEIIHSVVENNQLLRQWDNVPRKAKAQEVSSNRIIYGNYLQNYNVTNKVDFTVSREDYAENTSVAGQRTVKSNRNYQVGVVYIDEFNRQSPVFSNPSGVLNIDKKFSIKNNAIKAKINSAAPAWASHFKYFIKETSNEYYNIAVDRIYQEEDDPSFVWLSLPSADVNKLKKEDYLILKKEHDAAVPVTSINNRFKVLEIKNEPPEFITAKQKIIMNLSQLGFVKTLGAPTSSNVSTRGLNQTPFKGGTSINISKADGSDGISDSKIKNLATGQIIKFIVEANGQESSDYKIKNIKNITGSNGSQNFVQITIFGSFGPDVEALYSDAGALYNNITMQVSEKEPNVNTSEFAGRFFIKIKNNSVIEKSIIEKLTNEEDKEYIAIHTESQINGDDSENGKAGDGKRGRIFPYFVSHGGLKNGGGGTSKLTRPQRRGKKYKDPDTKTVFDVSFSQSNGRFTNDTLLSVVDIGSKIRFSTHEHIYEVEDIKVTSYADGNVNVFGAQVFSIDKPKTLHIRFTERLKENLCIYGKSAPEFGFSILKEKVNEEGEFSTYSPAIFETEPQENIVDLDLYYETQDAYSINQHGEEHTLRWYNAFNFNGVESNRIRDDFNAPTIDKGVRASTTLEEKYKEDRVSSGMIWSGIINSKNGINESNQFIQALNITKNLLPSYGSIQKLYTRDSDLVALCEDKVVKVLADKDMLYNADGTGNLAASNLVLGSAIPFNGEYGIGLNPESFAVYGYRIYFVDKVRGAVLRLSMDGLTDISMAGVSDFFNNRLNRHNTFIGSYDEYNGCYNVSIPCLDTICFDETSNGWTSRKSFVPESGVSLNSKFYTCHNGELWEQDSDNVPRNNFYGTQYTSSIQYVINQDASVVKRFKTLSYEGTKDWKAKIITDQGTSSTLSFIEKENKYFSNIQGEEKDVSNIDLKNFSVQGIGKPSDVSSVLEKTKKTFKIKLKPKTIAGFNCGKPIINETGITTKEAIVSFNNTDKLAKIEIQPEDGYELDPEDFKTKNINWTKEGNNLIAEVPVKELENIEKANDDSDFKEEDSIIVDDIENANGNGEPKDAAEDAVEDGFDRVFEIPYTGEAKEKDFTVSGTFTSNIQDASIDISSDTYTVTNTKNRRVQTVVRKITPNSGFIINVSDIESNNNRATFDAVKNDDGTITLTEFITIDGINETNLDYEISLSAVEEVVPNPVIEGIIVVEPSLPLEGGELTVEVIGDPEAQATLLLLDSDGNLIDSVPCIIPDEGEFTTTFNVPEVNDNTTITIQVDVAEGTDEAEGIQLGEPIVINQKQNDISEIKISALSYIFTDGIIYPSGTSNTQIITGYENESSNGTKTFSWEIGPPSGVTWNKIRDIVSSDFISISGKNNIIEYSNLSSEILTSGNTGYLKVTADVYVEEFLGDQEIVLNIDNIVSKEITLTFSFGVPGGVNYTYSSANDIDVTGNAGSAIGDAASNILLFKLIPFASYNFEKPSDIGTFLKENFILEENSADVTSTYSDSFVYEENDDKSISVGFKIKRDVLFPNSDSTIILKPKTSSTFDSANKTISNSLINIYLRDSDGNTVDGIPYVSTTGGTANLFESFSDNIELNVPKTITKTITPVNGFTFEGAGSITTTTTTTGITLGSEGVTTTINDDGAIVCSIPYTATSENCRLDVNIETPDPIRKITPIVISTGFNNKQDAASDNVVQNVVVYTNGDPENPQPDDKLYEDEDGTILLPDLYYSIGNNVVEVKGGSVNVLIDKSKIDKGTKPIIDNIRITSNSFAAFTVVAEISYSGGANISEVGIIYDTIYQLPNGLTGSINLPVNTLNQGKYSEFYTNMNIPSLNVDTNGVRVSVTDAKPTDHGGPLYVTKDGGAVSSNNPLFEHTPVLYLKAYAKNTRNSDNVTYSDTIQVPIVYNKSVSLSVTTTTASNVSYIKKNTLSSNLQIGNWQEGYKANFGAVLSNPSNINTDYISYGILISEQNSTPAFNSDFTLPSNVKMFVFNNNTGTSVTGNLNIYNLRPDTTYYYRSFAWIKGKTASDIPYNSNNNAAIYPFGVTLKNNWQGTGTTIYYGSANSLTTGAFGLPTVVTNDATDKTSNSAKLNGNITSINGSVLLSKGFVLSAQGIPDIRNNDFIFNISGQNTGVFNKTVNNLLTNINYRYRAFGEGERGFSYGNIKTFALEEARVPILNISDATSIDEVSAVLNGEIESAGNSSVTESGFIYFPGTIVDTINFDINYSGATIINTSDFSGNFSKVATDLAENTTYSFRAFAKNEGGYGYSSEILTFTTEKSVVLPAITMQPIEMQNINYSSGPRRGEGRYTYELKISGIISNTESFSNIGLLMYSWNREGTKEVLFYKHGYRNQKLVKNGNNISYILKNEINSRLNEQPIMFQFWIQNNSGKQYSQPLMWLPPLDSDQLIRDYNATPPFDGNVVFYLDSEYFKTGRVFTPFTAFRNPMSTENFRNFQPKEIFLRDNSRIFPDKPQWYFIQKPSTTLVNKLVMTINSNNIKNNNYSGPRINQFIKNIPDQLKVETPLIIRSDDWDNGNMNFTI